MALDEIRVSCAILCRFWVKDKLLLLLNRNRRAQGIYELSPLGGAIEAESQSNVFVRMKLNPENGNSNDLRFFIRRSQLEDFAKWFYQRKEREITPFRELKEELVEEARLLPNLQMSDLTWQFLYSYEAEQVTQREGVEGVWTHYFLEVFEVFIQNSWLEEILLKVDSASGALLVDERTARNHTNIQMYVDGMMRTVRLNTQSLFQDRD
ncbi:MAG: hypothetical protein CUN55_05260 [Phototrophicales bacterium]|nr:MAG: hypothetical protein CUN55_05260 [Phototrophicales bacterium]